MTKMMVISKRKAFIVIIAGYFMTEADLEAGLQSLRKSLKQIKALLAWEELKQSEIKPGQPPTFRFDDNVEIDLRNEYSFFLYTSIQMHRIIADGTVNMPEAERQYIRQQLIKLEHKLHNLDLQQRFCRCVSTK